MNNLHELYKISEELITPLQASVVFLSGKHLHDALRAADELAALNARVEELEKLEAVAESVNKWLKANGLAGTAHQRELEAALKGAE